MTDWLDLPRADEAKDPRAARVRAFGEAFVRAYPGAEAIEFYAIAVEEDGRLIAVFVRDDAPGDADERTIAREAQAELQRREPVLARHVRFIGQYIK